MCSSEPAFPAMRNGYGHEQLHFPSTANAVTNSFCCFAHHAVAITSNC